MLANIILTSSHCKGILGDMIRSIFLVFFILHGLCTIGETQCNFASGTLREEESKIRKINEWIKVNYVRFTHLTIRKFISLQSPAYWCRLAH